MNEHQVVLVADAIKMVAKAIIMAALIRVNWRWYENDAVKLLKDIK